MACSTHLISCMFTTCLYSPKLRRRLLLSSMTSPVCTNLFDMRMLTCSWVKYGEGHMVHRDELLCYRYHGSCTLRVFFDYLRCSQANLLWNQWWRSSSKDTTWTMTSHLSLSLSTSRWLVHSCILHSVHRPTYLSQYWYFLASNNIKRNTAIVILNMFQGISKGRTNIL